MTTGRRKAVNRERQTAPGPFSNDLLGGGRERALGIWAVYGGYWAYSNWTKLFCLNLSGFYTKQQVFRLQLNTIQPLKKSTFNETRFTARKRKTGDKDSPEPDRF